MAGRRVIRARAPGRGGLAAGLEPVGAGPPAARGPRAAARCDRAHARAAAPGGRRGDRRRPRAAGPDRPHAAAGTAMSSLAVRSELDKLSQTLELSDADLAFLEAVPPRALRSLRAAVYEQLARDDRVLFERLGAIARRLPLRATVLLARRVGPLVAAQVVAETPSARARALAGSVPIEFLADVCVHLDPRRTRDLIAQLPAERLADVGARADPARRPHHDEPLRRVHPRARRVPEVIAAIEDEGALLRIGFYMGAKNRVDHLFRMLPRGAARGADRAHAGAARRAAAGAAVAAHPRLLRAQARARRHRRRAGRRPCSPATSAPPTSSGLWPDMLRVVAAMSPAARDAGGQPARSCASPTCRTASSPPPTSTSCGASSSRWSRSMDDANRDAVAAIVAARGEATLANAADAALMGEHWEVLLDLVRAHAGRQPGALRGHRRGPRRGRPRPRGRLRRRAGAARRREAAESR